MGHCPFARLLVRVTFTFISGDQFTAVCWLDRSWLSPKPIRHTTRHVRKGVQSGPSRYMPASRSMERHALLLGYRPASVSSDAASSCEAASENPDIDQNDLKDGGR